MQIDLTPQATDLRWVAERLSEGNPSERAFASHLRRVADALVLQSVAPGSPEATKALDRCSVSDVGRYRLLAHTIRQMFEASMPTPGEVHPAYPLVQELCAALQFDDLQLLLVSEGPLVRAAVLQAILATRCVRNPETATHAIHAAQQSLVSDYPDVSRYAALVLLDEGSPTSVFQVWGHVNPRTDSDVSRELSHLVFSRPSPHRDALGELVRELRYCVDFPVGMAHSPIAFQLWFRVGATEVSFHVTDQGPLAVDIRSTDGNLKIGRTANIGAALEQFREFCTGAMDL
jgi:hypothetical protein